MKRFLKEYLDEIVLVWFLGLVTYLAYINAKNQAVVLAVIALDAFVFGFYKWYNREKDKNTDNSADPLL